MFFLALFLPFLFLILWPVLFNREQKQSDGIEETQKKSIGIIVETWCNYHVIFKLPRREKLFSTHSIPSMTSLRPRFAKRIFLGLTTPVRVRVQSNFMSSDKTRFVFFYAVVQIIKIEERIFLISSESRE